MSQELREMVRQDFAKEAEQLVKRAAKLGFVLTIDSRLTPEGEKSRYAVIDVRHARGNYPKEPK